ncbi:MAG: hydroxymethylpyrimidine/phosphomethylpyrimidine kinase [Thermosediminibacterales bacterium]|nr:hydroxymethylpyrimidine/phosphomethylpyrimidine kinase [Thermosediminibacterales bacterium]MDK2835926.1 hydroxymethylpyrimidine/phosphomethylpyrimidine kinase [Thermosediminibacterales bacterium]
MKKVLTIAGSDSCGGAGIQADLKTFSALGVYGMSVITAVTAQNTQGVFGVEEISPDMVAKQLDAVFQDILVDAVKVGMVFSTGIIEVIADRLKKYNIQKVVLDTVMVSKSGCHLLRSESIKALIDLLIPKAYVVTPNLYEAKMLTGISVHTLQEMQEAARKIYNMGAKNVVVKGGHRIEDATDILYDGSKFYHFPGHRIDTKNTHGTGCTFSSAIASYLALGHRVDEAVKKSKEYITGAIANSLDIGKGVGPTNHFYKFDFK